MTDDECLRLDGLQLGPLRLDRLLGRGGFGAVYRAYNEQLPTSLRAVKILFPSKANTPTIVERLKEEARIIEKLQKVPNDNLVRFYDLNFDSAHGLWYITLELLEGEPLSKRMGQPMPVKQACDIVMQAARGLVNAHHNHSIVHRDIKPENLFLTTDNVVKVLDFGIAKAYDADRIPGTSIHLLLTPLWAAPETWTGSADARSDVYALGLILWALLSGSKTAFPGIARPDFGDHLTERPHLSTYPTPFPVPKAIADVVARCTSSDKAKRYSDAGALLDALEAATKAPIRDRNRDRVPPQLRPQTVVVGASAGAVLIIGAVVGFVMLVPKPVLPDPVPDFPPVSGITSNGPDVLAVSGNKIIIVDHTAEGAATSKGSYEHAGPEPLAIRLTADGLFGAWLIEDRVRLQFAPPNAPFSDVPMDEIRSTVPGTFACMTNSNAILTTMGRRASVVLASRWGGEPARLPLAEPAESLHCSEALFAVQSQSRLTIGTTEVPYRELTSLDCRTVTVDVRGETIAASCADGSIWQWTGTTDADWQRVAAPYVGRPVRIWAGWPVVLETDQQVQSLEQASWAVPGAQSLSATSSVVVVRSGPSIRVLERASGSDRRQLEGSNVRHALATDNDVLVTLDLDGRVALSKL